jgi:hypothetical protein
MAQTAQAETDNESAHRRTRQAGALDYLRRVLGASRERPTGRGGHSVDPRQCPRGLCGGRTVG